MSAEGFSRTGPRARSAARLFALVWASLLLAACCSEKSPAVQQQANAAAAAGAAAATGIPASVATPATATPDASGQPQLMTFETMARDGVNLTAELVSASCEGDVASGAVVRLGWTSTVPGINGIRVSVVDDKGAKVWAEGGISGNETTGAWVKDGLTFRFEDKANRASLGEVRAVSGRCGSGE